MGAFPSHDAPLFLYTTAVQKPNETGAGIEVCLIPLLRRHYNDNVMRIKDSIAQVCFDAPPLSTQIAVTKLKSGNTGDKTNDADVTTAAVNSYKAMEYLLAEVESSFYSSGRVVLQAGELAAQKVRVMLASREAREKEEEMEFWKKARSKVKEEEAPAPTPTPVIEKQDTEETTGSSTDGTHPAMPTNKKQWPMLRPVPCAICIIEPDSNNNTKKGSAPSANTVFTVNGVPLTDSFQIGGRRMFCIGYISCFSTRPNNSEHIKTVVEKCNKMTQDGISTASDAHHNVNAAAAKKVPMLHECKEDGLDIYFEMKLNHLEEFRHMIDPILFLACINFRSQYLTCSMWQRPSRCREVEDVYYNHLRLLRLHFFLPRNSVQLNLFHEQYSLLELVEELGLSDKEASVDEEDRVKRPSEEREDIEVANYMTHPPDEEAEDEPEEKERTEEEFSMRKKVRHRSKRRSRKPRCPLPQDEIYRTTTCNKPQLSLYEGKNGEGLEVAVDGDVVARFMKFVTETASFETIKNSFVRVDMGPFFKERRYLQSLRESKRMFEVPAEEETMYGSEEIANRVMEWVRERLRYDEERKVRMSMALKEQIAVAEDLAKRSGMPHAGGVHPSLPLPTAAGGMHPGLAVPGAPSMAFSMPPNLFAMPQGFPMGGSVPYMIDPRTQQVVPMTSPFFMAPNQTKPMNPTPNPTAAPQTQPQPQPQPVAYQYLQTPQGVMMVPVMTVPPPSSSYFPMMGVPPSTVPMSVAGQTVSASTPSQTHLSSPGSEPVGEGDSDAKGRKWGNTKPNTTPPNTTVRPNQNTNNFNNNNNNVVFNMGNNGNNNNNNNNNNFNNNNLFAHNLNNNNNNNNLNFNQMNQFMGVNYAQLSPLSMMAQANNNSSTNNNNNNNMNNNMNQFNMNNFSTNNNNNNNSHNSATPSTQNNTNTTNNNNNNNNEDDEDGLFSAPATLPNMNSSDDDDEYINPNFRISGDGGFFF